VGFVVDKVAAPSGTRKAYFFTAEMSISIDPVKEDEIGRACSTNGGKEECI
jgi:hypothetical protein